MRVIKAGLTHKGKTGTVTSRQAAAGKHLTIKQAREMDARIDRVREQSLETLKEIQNIGRR